MRQCLDVTVLSLDTPTISPVVLPTASPGLGDQKLCNLYLTIDQLWLGCDLGACCGLGSGANDRETRT